MKYTKISEYVNISENENKLSITINNNRFRVIDDVNECKCKDGRYRAVYIQISEKLKLYYIGKQSNLNAKHFNNYIGSGILFHKIYDKCP